MSASRFPSRQESWRNQRQCVPDKCAECNDAADGGADHDGFDMVTFAGYRDAVQVGAGGLGNLYRAVRESTGGDVAIKELREVGSGSPTLHRARRELEALASQGSSIRHYSGGNSRRAKRPLFGDGVRPQRFVDGQVVAGWTTSRGRTCSGRRTRDTGARCCSRTGHRPS